MAGTQTPVLIYAPGLGTYAENTADNIADVLARTLDWLDPDATFGTKTDPAVKTARGLRTAKTIVDGQNQPVLQLFELDYLPALEPTSSTAGPSVVPGLVRSATLAVIGGLKWWAALRRPAKTAKAKFQLLVGFVAAGALIFTALVALYSALVAIGLSVPGSGIFGETGAPWTFGISSLGLVITWTALRKSILSLAATVERLIRFVGNDGAVADTTSVILDEAVDGLRKNEWNGKVHLLGFSFGSLVLYEAMFPRENSMRLPKPVEAIASLTTIGCPLDMVRLYVPSFTNNRSERRPQLPWINIFNAADIFASNLMNRDDSSEGQGSALDNVSRTPESIRYLDENLSLFRIFSSGKIHAGYWGPPERANCFERLAAAWVS